VTLSGQALVDTALAPQPLGPTPAERAYSYDAGSNRIGEIQGAAGRHDYPVDDLDQVQGHPYDADGNPQGYGTTYSYDEHRRLVHVDGGGTTFTATYDALGRRVSINDSTKTRFAYDGLSEIAEYHDDGQLSLEHIGAGPLDQHLSLALADGNEYFVHADTIGSTRLITNAVGQVAGRYEYDPYGSPLPATMDLTVCRFRFMGREWDRSSDLYHFRARHYNHAQGRFLQRDPAESEMFRSEYAAFRSNPLTFVDPTGTSAKGAEGVLQLVNRGAAASLSTTIASAIASYFPVYESAIWRLSSVVERGDIFHGMMMTLSRDNFGYDVRPFTNVITEIKTIGPETTLKSARGAVQAAARQLERGTQALVQEEGIAKAIIQREVQALVPTGTAPERIQKITNALSNVHRENMEVSVISGLPGRLGIASKIAGPIGAALSLWLLSENVEHGQWLSAVSSATGFASSSLYLAERWLPAAASLGTVSLATGAAAMGSAYLVLSAEKNRLVEEAARKYPDDALRIRFGAALPPPFVPFY
jgi:RHS repeat-associated protein